MTLVTESGAGLADAESFASVDFATAYHAARGNAAWAPATDDAKESALRKATEYLQQVHGLRWKGERMLSTQALDWPRWGAIVDNVEVGYDSVPNAIQKACASLALRALSAPLAPDIQRETASESIAGAVAVTYREGAPAYVRYREIDGLLARYLRAGNSGLMVTRA
ncbi:MAG TPA: DnaT-like ssDNA-binding protein [Rhodanobacteraceae bacterium]|nr:DnaT-like ssDNA-binding protein [Rhodanobacteraceae bacterium]